MYPQIRMVRQALMLGLVVTLVVLAASACGSSGAKDGEEKAGTLKTVAGDGRSQLGDGGPAQSAGLCGPNDVTLDAQGNLYISDGGLYCGGPGGNTVRKVNPDGIITTVAGTGHFGFSGDGGSATKAQLNLPLAVAVDREGNLYIADADNYRVRKVDKEGIIHTFAGSGKKGNSADGGPATKAALNEPSSIVFDGEGILFILCHRTSVVCKVDKNDTITTIAGKVGWQGINREKGPARKVWLNEPIGLVFDDDAGVLYIGDTFNSRIRAVYLEGS